MKEIQGRLKNKNKLRSPLGRVEKKQRLIKSCRLMWFCCLLKQHHVKGDSRCPCFYRWLSMRIPVLSLPLWFQPQDPVLHLWRGESFFTPSAILLWLLWHSLWPQTERECRGGPQSSREERPPLLWLIQLKTHDWPVTVSVAGQRSEGCPT